MANGNLAACLKVTLSHEGGWSDHPADPGGATMKGVTIGRYRQYYPNATKTDLRNISDADLQRIYRDDYWNKVSGDSLPYGIDLATFDFGVNSGPPRGVRYLQAVLGVTQDGKAGRETIKAAILSDVKATIQKLCAKRLGFVRALSTFKVFGKGWSRRIADVEAKAVAMWLTRGKPLTPADRKALEQEAIAAKQKADKQNKGAGSAVGGGGAVGGGDAIVSGEPNWLLIAGLAVVVLAVVAVLIVKARQNKDRSKAYAAVASSVE